MCKNMKFHMEIAEQIGDVPMIETVDILCQAVPTKKSVRIEIVALMESRPVTFPNHDHFAFLPARLLAIPRCSAGRNSRPPSSAIDLQAFPPRS
jgi:hypothetical protein